MAHPVFVRFNSRFGSSFRPAVLRTIQRLSVVSTVSLLLSATMTFGQEHLTPPPPPPAPALVADLLTGLSAVGSHPFPVETVTRAAFIEPRDELLFWATDEIHGTELWLLEQDSLQPRRLTDLCPGLCSSGPSGAVVTAPWPGEPFLLAANDGATGAQLWRIPRDGTAAVRLTDFVEGTVDAPLTIDLSDVVLDDGRLLFTVRSSESRGAWSTDGTRDGTQPLWPLEETRHLTLGQFHDLGEHIVFPAYSEELGTEWYRTDSSGAVPELIADVCPGPCPVSTSEAVQLDDRVIFRWLDSEAQPPTWRTWVTDGEVTYPLDAVCGSPCGFTELSRVGDVAYFFRDQQLWRTDGTVAGTVVLANLPSGWRPAFNPVVEIDGDPAVLLFDAQFDDALWRLHQPQITFPPSFELLVELGSGNFQLVSTGSQLMVLSTSSNRLWLSDGTAEGTEGIELGRPPVQWLGNPSSAVAAGGRFYFTAAASSEGRELWTSDGSAAGTRLVADLAGDPASSLPRDFAASAGELAAVPQPGVFFTTIASASSSGGEQPTFLGAISGSWSKARPSRARCSPPRATEDPTSRACSLRRRWAVVSCSTSICPIETD